MGSEFLSENHSQTEGAPPSYAEQFGKAFPQYLAMGMTPTQYWDGDCTLVKYYREAYRLKQEHENYRAWLQGAYVYDAFCAASPVLHAFAKKGTKPTPYMNEPYPIFGAAKQTETSEEVNPLQTKFMNIANKFNAQFNAKGGVASAE